MTDSGDARDPNEEDEIAALRARVASLEGELGRLKAHVDAIFANTPAVFYVKDRDNRYQWASPYGFSLFGIPIERAIGRTDAELFPSSLAARFAASDRRVLEGQPLEDVSYAVPLPGGPRHFAGVRFPLPGLDGAPIAVCGFAIDITKQVELAQKLEKLAITDALTGLANRRRFDEHLTAELARAARSQEPLSLVLCDVDHFKHFNDRYGHLRGDDCLAAVARVLETVVRRPADLAARYGGEEFALVLPGTSEEGAAGVVTRLRSAVAELAIAHDDNDGRGHVTISAGIATVTGSFTSADVVDLADRALYRAKNEGRDAQVAVSDVRSVTPR